jgi:hypothetical protein
MAEPGSPDSIESIVLRVARDKIDDCRGKVLAIVFLQEVPSAFDCRMRLSLGAGDLKEDVLEGSSDRVAVAECDQEWLFELLECLPRL